MPWNYIVVITAFTYLGMMFGIAHYAERRASAGRSIINNPWIYSLSIAVYCTAWTYYGSVGRAASSGIDFLAVYIGPTLMVFLWMIILRKIIRICKTHRITTIADFISSRYSKSLTLGGLVTIFMVIGIVPYISLQIKAVATSINVLIQYPEVANYVSSGPIWFDTAFYVSIVNALFTIIFGTRHLDAFERHEGIVAAVAFESLVKLLAFLAVGIFVVYGMYDGFGDIFVNARSIPHLDELYAMQGNDYLRWTTITVISAMAIMFLPRQFQMLVVENIDENHIKKALWIFPLYLFLINIFVLPIAFGGLIRFPSGNVNPDTFVLTLPLAEQQNILAIFVFLGGLSAATAMVAVSSISISTMVSNNLILPIMVRLGFLRVSTSRDLSGLILKIRRISIIVLLLLGYFYFRLASGHLALVTIGLMSFAAAAQCGPAIIGGIFWKEGNRLGALTGLGAGFAVWAYTMLLPLFAQTGWLPLSFIEHGPVGLTLLKPYQLFGLEGLGWFEHGVFWSLLVNISGYFIVSMITGHRSSTGYVQSELFVDIFKPEKKKPYVSVDFSVTKLQNLLNRFLGEESVQRTFADYEQFFNGTEEEKRDLADYAEKILAGAIGATSARLAMASVVQKSAAIRDPIAAEESIRESESRLQAIMDNTSNVISLKDIHGHYILINHRFGMFFDVNYEEVVGKTDYDIFPEKLADTYQDNDNKALQAGAPIQVEEVYCQEDGCHTYLTIKFPMYDSTETVYGVCCIATDITDRKISENELQKSHDRLKQALEDTITAIAKAVEARDLYVAGHQKRVAQLAVAIAKEMELDDNLVEGIYMGAIIHDIGKIHLPAEILNKPAQLFDTEFSLVKSHPEVGYNILKDVRLPWPVAEIIHQHHEHLDGSGYPNELQGNNILLEARIVCVADVVEAMAGHRPYRPAKGIKKALKEIEKHKGEFYDPQVVDACLRLFHNKKFKFEEE
jgi:PAS domain S-box-containing protein/putative nucleotidyltransferase with HDIG domain